MLATASVGLFMVKVAITYLGTMSEEFVMRQELPFKRLLKSSAKACREHDKETRHRCTHPSKDVKRAGTTQSAVKHLMIIIQTPMPCGMHSHGMLASDARQ